MIVYNKANLYNLKVIREAKQWHQQGVIREDQFAEITKAYKSPLYSPNVVIRILLFIATLLALAGVTGLMVITVFDSSEETASVGCLLYGTAALAFLDFVLIRNKHHYKSGVTEALLYHSLGFVIGGVAVLSGNEYFILSFALLLFSFAAIRYLDLISAIAAFVSLAWLFFISLYALGGVFQQIIPFVFMSVFFILYFMIRWYATQADLYFWNEVVLVIKVCCLITVYVAGNYFVVQNLSESMMGIEGQVPFAWIFYGLTVIVPLVYLYVGVRYKNIALLRISLLALAFSAFTFKYYFSFGHPEITLTIAGVVVLSVALMLLNYLKTMRSGYTRENIYTEKWSNLNAEAFIISQTMGGNKLDVQEQEFGGGGSFGGGGASDRF